MSGPLKELSVLSKGWAELNRAASGLGMSRTNPDNPFR